MTLALEEIVRRLESGENPESVIHTARPAAESKALQRCAVLRVIDRDVAATYLLAGDKEDAPLSFDELLERGLLEPTSTEGRFRLQPDVRSQAFRNWWAGRKDAYQKGEIPRELRELSSTLATHYGHLDRGKDRFYHLVLADPAQALRAFEELYDEADGRFDLAACQDLIDALADPDRSPLLSIPLKNALQDRRAYLRARSDASIDYYRTARFLEPTGMRQQFERLLLGTDGRVLELHARGGMGKTMRLRWLVARHCIPERIPCVRIDFDVFDPVNASLFPWLVMLELAELLNSQVSAAPFVDLAASYGAFRPLLRRDTVGTTESASKLLDDPTTRTATGANVVARFTATLRESFDKPVVVIFDTLEELVTRPAADLSGFVQAFQQLHHDVPQLRLVFAGRNDLTSKVNTFKSGFGKAASIELVEFTDDEARRYLTEIEGVDRLDVVEVAIRKSSGVPLSLALFAEAIRERPDLTAEDLDDYVDPKLVWLIERVLAKIPEKPVRWLVRYGVVPRRLTLDFAQHVMQTHLGRGMPKPSRFDDPTHDAVSPMKRGQQLRLFEHGQPGDIAALWSTLRQYASRSSWVTEEPPDQALVFHENVREPMRRVLRRHRAVYRALHTDAAAYFERRAATEPDQWARLMREAVYHWFLAMGPSAGTIWEGLLQRASIEGRENGRRDLALAVLDPEFVDEQGLPAVVDGKRTIFRQTLVKANFEVARAAIADAKASGGGASHPEWSRARKHFDRAVGLQGRSRIIPVAQLRLAEAELLAARGEFAAAQSRLRSALARVRDPRSKLEIQLALADVEAATQSDASGDTLSRALRDLRGGVKGIAAAVVDHGRLALLRRLAIEHQKHDRIALAIQAVDEAIRIARKRADDDIDALRLTRVALLTAAGEPNRAIAEVPSFTSTIPPLPVHSGILAVYARAELAAWRPHLAIDATRWAPDPGTRVESGEGAAPTADALEVRALAYAALLRPQSDVAAAFEHAAAAMTAAGSVDGAIRCHLASGTYALREIGDLQHARSQFELAESLAPPEFSDQWVALQLRWAEYFDRVGDGATAATRVDTVLELLAKRSGAPPRYVAAAAFEGLARINTPDPARYVETLIQALRMISPPFARLTVLDRLDRVPTLAGLVPATLLGRLKAVAGPEERPAAARRPTGPDAYLAKFATLELQRMLGGADRDVVESLDRLADQLVRGGTTLLGRRWLRLAFGVPPPSPSATNAVLASIQVGMSSEPGIVASALVSAIEQAAEGSNPNIGSVGEYVAHAEPLLESPAPSQWTARLHLALGHHARSRGDLIEFERRLRLALTVYERFGDRTMAERIRSDLEYGTFGGRETDTELAVRLELRDGRLTVELPASHQDAPFGGAIESTPLAQALAATTAQPINEQIIRRLAGDPIGFGRELGELLGLDRIAARAAGAPSPTDVRIEAIQRECFAVPWELARVPTGGDPAPIAMLKALGDVYRSVPAPERASSEEVRFLQSGLNRLMNASLAEDGFLGAQTERVLREYQQQHDLPPHGRYTGPTKGAIKADLQRIGLQGAPVVVIARPSRDRQQMVQRGSLGREGIDVAEVYSSRGCEVHVLEDPSPGELSKKLFDLVERRRFPSICHLAGALVETRGAWLLDLGNESYGASATSGGAVLSARELDSVLRTIPDTEMNPILILEPAAPPGPSDVARHLWVRNGFAGEVFVAGSAPAVVGVGLVSYATAEVMFGLLDPLLAGTTLGEACRNARRQRSGGWALDDDIAIPAIALFAHSPTIGLVPADATAV
jgi:tetratricopeptide (TPR) repeat protein